MEQPTVVAQQMHGLNVNDNKGMEVVFQSGKPFTFNFPPPSGNPFGAPPTSGNTFVGTPIFGNPFGTAFLPPAAQFFAKETSNTLPFGNPLNTFKGFGTNTTMNTGLPQTSNTGTASFKGSLSIELTSGTSQWQYNPPTGTDTMMKGGVTTNINTRHLCITTMKEYEDKSIEELRLEDYMANRKGPSAPTPSFSFGTTKRPTFLSATKTVSRSSTGGKKHTTAEPGEHYLFYRMENCEDEYCKSIKGNVSLKEACQLIHWKDTFRYFFAINVKGNKRFEEISDDKAVIPLYEEDSYCILHPVNKI